MLLHLVRHAHALAESENPSRPLSSRGRSEAARLARFFAANGCFRPAQIWHSPLLRSRETTDELVRRLGLGEAVIVETSGLLPEDDPHELAERLELMPKDRGDLALIGHEPHLSTLAALLVRGKASADLFKLRKCAALALESTGRTHKRDGLHRWRVRWQVAPELLPATVVPVSPPRPAPWSPSAATASASAVAPAPSSVPITPGAPTTQTAPAAPGGLSPAIPPPVLTALPPVPTPPPAPAAPPASAKPLPPA